MTTNKHLNYSLSTHGAQPTARVSRQICLWFCGCGRALSFDRLSNFLLVWEGGIPGATYFGKTSVAFLVKCLHNLHKKKRLNKESFIVATIIISIVRMEHMTHCSSDRKYLSSDSSLPISSTALYSVSQLTTLLFWFTLSLLSSVLGWVASGTMEHLVAKEWDSLSTWWRPKIELKGKEIASGSWQYDSVWTLMFLCIRWMCKIGKCLLTSVTAALILFFFD